ncbi:polysaccharide lyase family 1 protein [Microlunatus elymi]|uniref:Polysaccharide lyase family 1 protein n=1 Tax=Microlunatus elymi TaxID=2596828 RepID=A0A516Q1E4_9ACTN|nr:polysaccharide lyase family 1 protein [Microlunatus elymi]QDP97250.1 polysaccharide lyase family 1 protein [Microlunatus elymi]
MELTKITKPVRGRLAVAAAALSLAVAGMVVASPSAGADPGHDAAPSRPVGWASTDGGVTGGGSAGAANRFVVHNRAELINAVNNGGQPNAPKVIKVVGNIYGDDAGDGTHLGQQDYRPGWDLDRYIACYGPDAMEWSDSRYPDCGDLRRGRVMGSNAEKAQIQITLGSNTTLVGLGNHAKLTGIYLTINGGSNIIVQNLTMESPIDYFPSWDPGDGGGSWNARFDAMSIVTGTHVWIDHVTFTDGAHPDSAAEIGPHTKIVQQHDGLLDMEDGTNLVTVSNSVFDNHSKTLLLGSGDSKGDRDRGKLRITFVGNHFIDSEQRSPRVRFGRVDVVNNLYTAATDDPQRPILTPKLGGPGYFLGLGLESQIYSRYNAFDYTGPGADSSIIAWASGGTRFFDRGSWFNGRKVDAIAVARASFDQAKAEALADAAADGTEPPAWTAESFQPTVDWNPDDVYQLKPLHSERQVTRSVLANAGAGRI